ncbi:hypothetical protein BH24CHL6_BH24CHL6_08070 [soil metagenome]
MAAAFLGAAWCLLLGGLLDGDPMLVIEFAGGVLAGAWAILVIRDVAAARRLGAALAVDSEQASLFGVRCRVTPALGVHALVLGAIRPQIFIGTRLLAGFAQDELKAVVYHEDHHRRTRAPLRASALAAWLRLLGRSERVRTIVDERLMDLETMADADAIRRGSSASSLARALLKGDLSPQPVAFSYATDRRVEHLLERAAGSTGVDTRRLPYEWLPVALLTVASLACHVGL